MVVIRKTMLILAVLAGSIIISASAMAEQAKVSVLDAKICQGVSEQEPQAVGDIFPMDIEKLYCYSKIASPVETTVTHKWVKDDVTVAEVPLSVGVSSGWRTFSSKRIPDNSRGNWKVEIVSEQGELLQSVLFVIN